MAPNRENERSQPPIENEPSRDLRPAVTHTAAELAAWRCDQTDPIEYQMQVLDWLYMTGTPSQDGHRRGISEVRLERHGDQTTVVVTRRTPTGAKPIRERWPMTEEPPARPSQEDTH